MDETLSRRQRIVWSLTAFALTLLLNGLLWQDWFAALGIALLASIALFFLFGRLDLH